jgi:hypothetical protein
VKLIAVMTLVRLGRSVGLAFGVALGASPVLAGALYQLNGASTMGATPSSSTPTGPIKKASPERLTLGLDILSTEFQAYRTAVAQGKAKRAAFATNQTVARVIDDRVVVDAVAADDPETLKADLEALGAAVTGVAGRMVSALIPLDKLPALEALDVLKFARPALATTRSGAVNSQGDPAQRSDSARADLGVDGTGSTVGVLSDSFNCSGDGSYAADQSSGDLPAGVNVLADFSTSVSSTCTDEGRAMAQIVHDVAPGAGLAFHTAFMGEADFAQGILDLAAAGSTIIVDDVFYYAEPMFQDGVIAQAADAVKAAGVPYFSAAGNDGRQAYQSAFTDSGRIGYLGGTLHDFDPGPAVDTRLAIQQTDQGTYVLQWSDPFFTVSGAPGAATDLDICFYSPADAATPIGCSSDFNEGFDPIEMATLIGTAPFGISIEKWSGPNPAQIKLISFGSMTFHRHLRRDQYRRPERSRQCGGGQCSRGCCLFPHPVFRSNPAGPELLFVRR